MRYQSLKLNLNFFYYYYFLRKWFQTEKEFTTVFEEISPQELNKSLQALSVKTAKPNFNGDSFFFFHYDSVKTKRARPLPSPPVGHLLGICHFVLEKLQMPLGGAQNIVQIPPPPLRQHQLKIVFSSK